ncbi:MAG: hypothetical protein ACI9S8_000803 [Chlamydiales bacterium]
MALRRNMKVKYSWGSYGGVAILKLGKIAISQDKLL